MSETQSDPRSDFELAQAYLEGEPGAGEALAHRLLIVPRIVRELSKRHRLNLTSSDVEDISQDVCLIVWKKLSQFHGPDTWNGWLYRFAQYRVMNFVRGRSYRTWKSTPLNEHTQEIAKESPERPEALEFGLLAEALQSLEPRDLSIVNLHHIQEVTFRDIADQLDLNISTVKTRYYRALKKLRSRMDKTVVQGEQKGGAKSQ